MSDRIESVRVAALAARVAVRAAMPPDADLIERAIDLAVAHLDDGERNNGDSHRAALAAYGALNNCHDPLAGAAQAVVWAAVNATAARLHDRMVDEQIARTAEYLARVSVAA